MAKLRFWVSGLLAIGTLVALGLYLMEAGRYGWTLFAFVPFLLGAIADWITRPARLTGSATAGLAAGALASLGLLLAHKEGAICIVMALPLTLPLGMIGGICMYFVSRARPSPAVATSPMALLLFIPVGTGTLTHDIVATPPLYEVRTSIEIAAPPQDVWRHVVTFSDLPEPTEWYFRTGLAYPQRARIDGTGVGAIRYCDFSTGPFVEPIEVWDEPRLLQFRVTENPAPMREWSVWGEIAPKHLHGYMISKKGQFKLTPLSNGRTLLEGTTWYQHGLWPAQYWRLWSDAIIHRIHLRVLTHIKSLAEQRD